MKNFKKMSLGKIYMKIKKSLEIKKVKKNRYKLIRINFFQLI